MNDFASGLILSTNTISCNTDMPQSRDISQRATKSLLLHLKKSKPAKLITGLMTSEQHKNSWIFISFWTTLSFSKETGRKRNCSTITYTLNVLLSECNTWKTSFSLQTVNISKILKKKQPNTEVCRTKELQIAAQCTSAPVMNFAAPDYYRNSQNTPISATKVGT